MSLGFRQFYAHETIELLYFKDIARSVQPNHRESRFSSQGQSEFAPEILGITSPIYIISSYFVTFLYDAALGQRPSNTVFHSGRLGVLLSHKTKLPATPRTCTMR